MMDKDIEEINEFNRNNKEKINSQTTLGDLLKMGTIVCIGKGKEYYNCPFWFERDDEDFIIHHLGSLPIDVEKHLEIKRLWDESA